MKLTKLFLLIVSVVVFACGEDEDPKPTAEAMVGTWSVTDVDYDGTSTTTVPGSPTIKSDFTGTGKDMDYFVTFTANPNNVTSEGSYTVVMTTTTLGQSVTEEYPFEDVLLNGTWTLDGNTMTITSPGEAPQEATVTEQSSTKMKIKQVVEETQTVSGITISIELEAIYTLEKN